MNEKDKRNQHVF